MAATYDPLKLKEHGKDRMRFDLGDTNMAEPLLQDEEIQVIIDENPGSWTRAKLGCAERIAEKMAPETSVRVGPMSLDLQARAKFWADKVDSLRKQVASMGAPRIAASRGSSGGTSEPYFRTGMHDNKG